MSIVDARLVEVALEYCHPTNFERFGQALLSARIGIQFIASGGMHDGGVDGFNETTLEQANGPRVFYQISKQLDFRGKIRGTVRRLRQSDRAPQQLILLTSHAVQNIDQEEAALSSELSLVVRIRDRRWITANVSSDSGAQDAFHSTIAGDVAFLSNFGATKFAAGLGKGVARTAYVFLAQEVERRRGDTQLLEAVTDSLLLWSLEGTDPDNGRFMTRAEIQKTILDVFPTAKQFLPSVMDARLRALASKQAGAGREVRWHRKEDKFCLPLETRRLVEQENVEDEALRLAVMENFTSRAESFKQRIACRTSANVIAEIANKTVEYVFEDQGLDTATFLTDQAPARAQLTVLEQTERAISEKEFDADEDAAAQEAVLEVLRGAFFASTAEEREYFGKLCRTYALFLSLKTEPRIVEYFRSMSARLTLFVGSDLLVLALSEHFLPPEDQMVSTMLKVVRASGATLVLCEPVLEEVLGQFRASDGEYRAMFEGIEEHISRDLARHASRILVRSYLYARAVRPRPANVPRTWSELVDQFIGYRNLLRPQGAVDLRRYLCNKFDMAYETREDMLVGVNANRLTGLAARLEATKEGAKIAERALNDATMALAVYARRHRNGEMGGGNPYGYSTWWLTKESRIRMETAEMVRSEGGRFMMIPEFLLNFIALAPTASEVRRSFQGVFPSRLGIRLSNRMREEVFQDAMAKAREAGGIDEARLHARLAELSDNLKGDRFKKYERSFDAERYR